MSLGYEKAAEVGQRPEATYSLSDVVRVMGQVRHAMESVIEGKRSSIDLALVVLLAEGHLLVEDVPGVFVYHYTPVQMIKPWIKGDFILPDDNGITSLHWPGYSSMDTSPSELYISSDASSRP